MMTLLHSIIFFVLGSSYSAAFTITSPVSKQIITSYTSVTPSLQTQQQKQQQQHRQRHILFAGGFEWEDPAEAFDQGVDNPFKNPELNLLKDTSNSDNDSDNVGSSNDGEVLKIDPARLLGPRLNGSNLYFVGMMGCGKSAVGDIVARREYCYYFFLLFLFFTMIITCYCVYCLVYSLFLIFNRFHVT